MQVPLINCQFATMCSTCLFEFTILQVKLFMFTFLSNLKCISGNSYFWFHFIHDCIGKWAQMNTFFLSKRTLLLLWNQRPDLKKNSSAYLALLYNIQAWRGGTKDRDGSFTIFQWYRWIETITRRQLLNISFSPWVTHFIPLCQLRHFNNWLRFHSVHHWVCRIYY